MLEGNSCVTDSIIFVWFFTVKDRCKKVHFQQMYNRHLRQLISTLSKDLRVYHNTADLRLRALQGHRVSSKRHSKFEADEFLLKEIDMEELVAKPAGWVLVSVW